MILSEYILGASNLVYNGFWFILDVSSFIGQNLVDQILVILVCAIRILEQILVLLGVIYEDSVFFFKDLLENLSYFIGFIVEKILDLRDGMISVSATLTYCATILPKLFDGVLNYLLSTFLAPLSFTWTVITLVWDKLLLIGFSFWLAVMSAPRQIFDCITDIFEHFLHLLYSIFWFFTTVCNLMSNGVHNIFTFIYNIPYSSISGLVITVILFYYVIKNFKKICIFSLAIFFSVVLFLVKLLYKICMSLFFAGKNLFGNKNDFDIQYESVKDMLCVICQVKAKEVIVLPCRHLCLCVSCERLLLQTQRLCPMCRSYIESVMKVYM